MASSRKLLGSGVGVVCDPVISRVKVPGANKVPGAKTSLHVSPTGQTQLVSTMLLKPPEFTPKSRNVKSSPPPVVNPSILVKSPAPARHANPETPRTLNC